MARRGDGYVSEGFEVCQGCRGGGGSRAPPPQAQKLKKAQAE